MSEIDLHQSTQKLFRKWLHDFSNAAKLDELREDTEQVLGLFRLSSSDLSLENLPDESVDRFDPAHESYIHVQRLQKMIDSGGPAVRSHVWCCFIYYFIDMGQNEEA